MIGAARVLGRVDLSKFKIPRRDPAFLNFVRAQTCLVSRGPVLAICEGPVQAHHEPPKSHAGDWDDRKTVPLCLVHHQGGFGRHYGIGSKEGFEAVFQIDLDAEIARLNEEFDREGPLF